MKIAYWEWQDFKRQKQQALPHTAPNRGIFDVQRGNVRRGLRQPSGDHHEQEGTIDIRDTFESSDPTMDRFECF